MILAIETATNICSVCFQDNEGKVFEKRTERKGSHSELLFLFIRELMTEYSFKMSDLDSVLVSTGPGSYTGLRRKHSCSNQCSPKASVSSEI
jgi:tRNA threonylcarbamoyl adenosine modification protein YeaZ